jgi:glycosyltransferase involved in cell wall biosynthesis
LISISLCMIVKNEEKNLGRCLGSVKDIVDEIIIVDTGSTDNTKQIARDYDAKIFDFSWIDDFSAARNYSFSLASKEYTMWLDADDIVLDKDQRFLSDLKIYLVPDFHSVTMNYSVGDVGNGRNTLKVRRNRLVKTNESFRWKGYVHEYLEVSGPIFHSDVTVTHIGKHGRSLRNLQIYEKLIEKGTSFSARDYFYYANELRRHRLFEKAIQSYHLFINLDDGWNEDKITACGRLADCYYKCGDIEKEMEAIYKSFSFDIPRADMCCRLGFRFLNEQKISQSIFWYELAVGLTWKPECLGFYDEPCWTWLPHLQLCVCYFKIGNYIKAYHHIKEALTYRPEDELLKRNKNLLEQKLKSLP